MLFWLALIFSASGDANSFKHSSTLFEPLMRWLFPGMAQTTIEQWHYYFRKGGHLTEFAILALLLWRAIRQPRPGEFRPWRRDQAGLALASTWLLAAGDEIHQVFVPSRTAQVSDVFIDTAGGAIGLIVLWGIGKFLKHW